MTQTVAATAPSFMYLETTIPAGLTISEYRRSRPQRRRGLKRLVLGAGGLGAGR